MKTDESKYQNDTLFMFISQLLWTLQQVQCFKTVWNELCNILIMVSDGDYGPANGIIICTIKKVKKLCYFCFIAVCYELF